MELGLIGLGRMGAGLGRRLLARGHTVVGFDLSPENVAEFARAGGTGATSPSDLVARLVPPRAVWVMVPHGAPTHDTMLALLDVLEPGDVLVDGGNSDYRDAAPRAALAAEKGVLTLDVGTSGGVWGEREGFNLMIGGEADAFARLEPIFRDLAPAGGYAHLGPSGAGHFVKMVHNAIEYGMLQAIGEGFECLHRSEYGLDLGQVARLWENGSVVRSWLVSLTGRAFAQEGNSLEGIGAYIDDSGTGRWALEYALDRGVPVPAIAASLFERFDSRTERRFAHQLIAALRNQFGGHAIVEEGR